MTMSPNVLRAIECYAIEIARSGSFDGHWTDDGNATIIGASVVLDLGVDLPHVENIGRPNVRFRGWADAVNEIASSLWSIRINGVAVCESLLARQFSITKLRGRGPYCLNGHEVETYVGRVERVLDIRRDGATYFDRFILSVHIRHKGVQKVRGDLDWTQLINAVRA